MHACNLCTRLPCVTRYNFNSHSAACSCSGAFTSPSPIQPPATPILPLPMPSPHICCPSPISFANPFEFLVFESAARRAPCIFPAIPASQQDGGSRPAPSSSNPPSARVPGKCKTINVPPTNTRSGGGSHLLPRGNCNSVKTCRNRRRFRAVPHNQ